VLPHLPATTLWPAPMRSWSSALSLFSVYCDIW